MASVALIHLHLFVFAIVPVHLVVLGLGLQAVYIGLIQKMPKIKLLSPLPLVAIVGLYIQKLCWFVHLGLNDEAASAQISLLIVSCVWVVPIFMFALANKLALDELAADIESPRENQLEASVDYWEGMSSSKLIQSFGHRSPLGKIQSLFKGKENGSNPGTILGAARERTAASAALQWSVISSQPMMKNRADLAPLPALPSLFQSCDCESLGARRTRNANRTAPP
eukprot:CAMPEP_0172177980 /NCGR_PEP_ID=MMETSP1050-20130122/15762_1 /TAXON_ID=233186 /ORGANISM="Cryptomonas curvata, Strain CCAP979/52" /LENGTH=224 /DNA_ID=CAMNT_0012850609 /DNA_START=162 /DNA_END=834 /DNA_ORIENTATION=+